jgi:hypothetical protein
MWDGELPGGVSSGRVAYGTVQSKATATEGRVSCQARTKNSTSDRSSRSSTARGYRTAHVWSLSCAAKQPAFRRLSINSGSNAPMLTVTRTDPSMSATGPHRTIRKARSTPTSRQKPGSALNQETRAVDGALDGADS